MDDNDWFGNIAIAIGIFILSFGLLMFAGLSGFTSGSPAANTDDLQISTTKIPRKIMERIENNKPVYVEAAKKEGIAWEMLAAVHFREGGNDPERSGPAGEAPGEINPDHNKVLCKTFLECEIVRARYLKGLSRGVYSVRLSTTSSVEDVKKAFLAYNRGSMYKNNGCSVNESPYVMNKFSEEYMNMRWPNNECEPSSTRGKVNVPAGAFTVYSILKGAQQ